MISYNNVLSGERYRAAVAADLDFIRVWLVDDNDDFRELLAELLNADGGLECTRQFHSSTSMLDALAREPHPDVILLDIRMRGENGLDAVRPIKSLAGSTQVLMLTTFYDSNAKARALQDGASGMLLKSQTVEEIARNIRKVKQEPVVMSACQSTDLETTHDSTSSLSLDSTPSTWPNRRVPGCQSGCLANDDMKPSRPEPGHRTAPWRSASSRLVRGVNYLRGLAKGALRFPHLDAVKHGRGG